MMSNNTRPPTAQNQLRRTSKNPFASVLLNDKSSDDIPQSLTHGIALDSSIPLSFQNDKDIDDDDDNDETSQASPSSASLRVRPPRPSMAMMASKSNNMNQRRRRRSSARFLNLSGMNRNSTQGANDSEEDDENEHGSSRIASSSNSHTNSTLQEMYQTAIRMNAENKINTTNTWNLHIIDQMDTLLSLNDKPNSSNSKELHSSNTERPFETETDTSTTANNSSSTGVNFTKASCTLDASVKIYSYRVDDVHLTSYKVLANLNRTQNNKNDDVTTKQSNMNKNLSGNDSENENEKTRQRDQNKSFNGNTLETNLGMFCSDNLPRRQPRNKHSYIVYPMNAHQRHVFIFSQYQLKQT
jgi:condensin complex subunit 2